jgi:hypothetical protein
MDLGDAERGQPLARQRRQIGPPFVHARYRVETGKGLRVMGLEGRLDLEADLKGLRPDAGTKPDHQLPGRYPQGCIE